MKIKIYEIYMICKKSRISPSKYKTVPGEINGVSGWLKVKTKSKCTWVENVQSDQIHKSMQPTP